MRRVVATYGSPTYLCLCPISTSENSVGSLLNHTKEHTCKTHHAQVCIVQPLHLLERGGRVTGSSLMSQDIPVAPAAAAGDWLVVLYHVSS